jgi:hypothetical protein
MSGTGGSAPLHGPQLRTLQRELVAAQDDQIARVLAIVDKLVVRGEADKLIAPLRGRLAELRPKRQLTLFRLLFTPLDPLIVNATDWTTGAPSIPRSALLPLAQLVHKQLGTAAVTIAEAAARHYYESPIDVLAELGTDLWPRAADVLSAATMPADWVTVSGLRPSDFTALAGAVAALLRQALPLFRVVARARQGHEPNADELRVLLEAVAPAGSQPLAMMIANAMGWLPRSQILVGVADDLVRRQDDPTVRATADRAVEFVLETIEQSPLPVSDLALATDNARRVAALLEDLDPSASQRPGRKSRLERVRRSVDAACRERFARELETHLVAPSAALATASDDAMAALEGSARDLRRFEATARRIGGAEQYDLQLQRAAAALRPAAGEDELARAGRIRLVEILQGPDAAMAMLKAGRI